MTYNAPIDEMIFTLETVADYSSIAGLPGNEDFDAEVVSAILSEAAKVAKHTLEPLNRPGDAHGAQLSEGKVLLPPGSREAHEALAAGGWIGLAENPDFGGQGVPHSVAAAVAEMWQATNPSYALCNLLTQGAIASIELNGSDEQKATYLPSLIDGTWTGTMNLTEPQAGSNLAAIRTMATPDGVTFRISGQKIFITHGEHDLTDNIIHLVLARTPNAPKGVKGLSLFVVPKVLVNEDGSLGAHNDVTCVSLEHKLGIHASPTAVLSFGDDGGAVGYLVGELNRGIEYMFVMMNAARFEIGVQGLGIAEASYQHARAYAAERKQGAAIGTREENTINSHPDVRRMLMNMKARIAAMRAIAYYAAGLRDKAQGDDSAFQTDYEYLIPLVTGWLTETCQQVTYDGLQVHGGLCFIEETGAAQFVRDARITTLYEGTTGIQATDLAFRKTARDQATAAGALLNKLSDIAAADAENGPALNATIVAAKGYLDWVVSAAAKQPAAVGATADTYLRAMGTLLGGVFLSKMARAAEEAQGESDFASAQSALSRHFTSTFIPLAQTMFEQASETAGPVTGFKTEWL